MLFDTHAHYDNRRFDADRDALLESMAEHGIGWIVNPGCDIESSEKAVSIAEQYDFVYAAVGVHPKYVKHMGSAEIDRLRELAAHPKVKALGEFGLDYFWIKKEPQNIPSKEEQEYAMRLQLDLAREVELPVIIHDREAETDCMRVIREYPDIRGVYHCFSGHLETAQELVQRGWYLSFGGSITYGMEDDSRNVLTSIPMENILLETDCPFLTPMPERKQNRRLRNSSLLIYRAAEVIAQYRGMTAEEVADSTTQNAKRFFGID